MTQALADHRIVARRLAAEAFAPFGHVLAVPNCAGRWYYGDLIENRRPAARLDLSFTGVDFGVMPLRLRLFERHAYSAQAFVPLDVSRYLVTVCPDDGSGRPDVMQAVSFIAGPDQAVVYAAGTWHHPMVALDRQGRFAIIMWAMGDDSDEYLVPLETPERLTVVGHDLHGD